jgi:hypothetical protein
VELEGEALEEQVGMALLELQTLEGVEEEAELLELAVLMVDQELLFFVIQIQRQLLLAQV